MHEPPHIPYASPGYDHERREVDNGHLKVLVICTYIWGGLAALASLIPLIHVGIGIAIITGALNGNSDSPPPPFLGWMFVGFGSGAIVLGELLAALNLYSAYKMSRRQGRVFSIVIAGINCLSAGNPAGGIHDHRDLARQRAPPIRRRWYPATGIPRHDARHRARLAPPACLPWGLSTCLLGS